MTDEREECFVCGAYSSDGEPCACCVEQRIAVARHERAMLLDQLGEHGERLRGKKRVSDLDIAEAVRADERERIAAHLDAESSRLWDGREAILLEGRDVDGWKMRRAQCEAIDWVADLVREGRHRRTK